jgi:AcrR family transcriptional regulator
MNPSPYLCRVISQLTLEDKPKKILATALKLFVTYGFHGTPTSRIAEDSGVSNGTLFHYFKTKDELVVALYIGIKDQINAFIKERIDKQTELKRKFQALFEASVEWTLDHKDEYYFIQQFHFSPHITLIPKDVLEKHAGLHAALLHEGVSAKLFKSIPVELIGSLAGNQINGVHQYLLDKELSPAQQKQTIKKAFDLTWQMLAKE